MVGAVEARDAERLPVMMEALCRRAQRPNAAPHELWAGYGEIVGPWYAVPHGVRAGERLDVESGVHYLEVEPRFFGSGYLAERLMRALAHAPELWGTEERLRDVVVRWASRPLNRTSPYVARLAARVWDQGLDERLGAISWNRFATPSAPRLRDRVLEILDARAGSSR